MIKNKSTTTIDGIICFKPDVLENHADYHALGLDKIYSAEKSHFWFITRREKIVDSFRKYVKKPANVLEIGAGTGYVAQGLKEDGYQISVGEIHLSGLRYAKQNGIESCYQLDLFDPPFQDEFDAIGMFDVLEHMDDDVHALRKVSQMLKPEGKILITVPAHQWLWSREDAISAHKKRYSKKTLTHTFEKAGLHVIEVRYFFITILPLLYFRHLINRDCGEKVSEHERIKDIYISPILNKILLGLTRLENYLLNWLPNIAGGSMLLVAVRKPEVVE